MSGGGTIDPRAVERRAVKRLGEALETIAARCRDPIEPYALVAGELVLALLAHAPPAEEREGGMRSFADCVREVLDGWRAEERRREEMQLRFELDDDGTEER